MDRPAHTSWELFELATQLRKRAEEIDQSSHRDNLRLAAHELEAVAREVVLKERARSVCLKSENPFSPVQLIV